MTTRHEAPFGIRWNLPTKNVPTVLLRAKKVLHQISVSFEKFDVVQALLSFF
jgi:hypothetical protein